MSDRILTPAFKPRNFMAILQQWLEVYEEGGENTASLGIIQLIFDKLKESCSNNSMRHVLIPETIDLRTFNLEEFVRTQIRGKEFVGEKQEQDDKNIAKLIALMVKNSDPDQAGWMRHVQNFIRILSNSRKTVLLVSKTIVHFYVEVIVLLTERNLDREFKNSLKLIRRDLVLTITKDDQDLRAMQNIVEAFFKLTSNQSEPIRCDASGCERIIGKFLTFDDVEVTIDVLTKLIQNAENPNYGNALLQVCSRQLVLDALSDIITNITTVKIQVLALELACRMQGLLRERDLFNIGVFRNCVISDNKEIRNLLANLCRLALRGPNRDIANPFDVLIRATRFHQQFRQNYTTCPKRLVNTFFTEFTDWHAVFQVIGLRTYQQDVLGEFFQLVRRALEQICITNNSDELRRSYSHMAIKFMEQLNRNHVKIYGQILYTIHIVDENLTLTDGEHCGILANIVSQILIDFFPNHSQQSNVMLFFTKLLQKGYIAENLLEQKVLETLDKRGNIHENVNFDANMMRVFMQVSVFAEHYLFKNRSADLCNQLKHFILMDRFDLSKNRDYLAYNLLSFVKTYLVVHKNGEEAHVPGFTQHQIVTSLFKILEQTQGDFDFLCVAVFWCLSDMEVLFKTISQTTHPNIMVQYVLQKVKLATNDELGVEEMQMEYLKYMVTQITRLMKNGSKIDVRDLVVHVYKKFQDYPFAFDLLKCGANIPSASNAEIKMLTECVLKLVDELRTKKMKEEFLKGVEGFLVTMPNEDELRVQILRVGSNAYGEAARGQHDSKWQKNANQICEVLQDVTLRNWSTMGHAASRRTTTNRTTSRTTTRGTTTRSITSRRINRRNLSSA